MLNFMSVIIDFQFLIKFGKYNLAKISILSHMQLKLIVKYNWKWSNRWNLLRDLKVKGSNFFIAVLVPRQFLNESFKVQNTFISILNTKTINVLLYYIQLFSYLPQILMINISFSTYKSVVYILKFY